MESVHKAAPANARRRLLRGVFSAPAALTLYSGGAVAAASNLRCVSNQQADPLAPAVSESNVTFVRIGLYRAGADPSSYTYWIKGSELPTNLIGGVSWPSISQFQQFDISSNVLVGERVNSTPSLSMSPTHWAVLRINGEGYVVGVGASGSGSAIFQSCWASFALGKP
jgi:hypothetical protein